MTTDIVLYHQPSHPAVERFFWATFFNSAKGDRFFRRCLREYILRVYGPYQDVFLAMEKTRSCLDHINILLIINKNPINGLTGF
jgi:hypothetical protein